MDNSDYRNVDEYINSFSGDVRDRLRALRAAIKAAAPDAQECISYRMPAYRQGGPLVYFAAFKNHIGFYPTANGMQAFRDEFKAYKRRQRFRAVPLRMSRCRSNL